MERPEASELLKTVAMQQAASPAVASLEASRVEAMQQVAEPLEGRTLSRAAARRKLLGPAPKAEAMRYLIAPSSTGPACFWVWQDTPPLPQEAYPALRQAAHRWSLGRQVPLCMGTQAQAVKLRLSAGVPP